MKKSTLQLGYALLNTIGDNGHEAYIVGGAVRDTFMEKELVDLDIVTSADMSEIIAIFPQATAIHTTVPLASMVMNGVHVEISELNGQPIVENLAFRDFTVNAIALNAEGEKIDPFLGEQDIQAGVLRLIDPVAITRDPLRILRVARFMAVYNLRPDQKLNDTCEVKQKLLHEVSPERIGQEMNRLLSSDDASKGLIWLWRRGVIAELFSGTRMSPSPSFAAVAEAETLSEKWVIFLYMIGERDVRESLRKWRLSKKWIKNAERLFFYMKKRLSSVWSKHSLYHAGVALAVQAERTAHMLSDTVPGGKLDVERLIASLPIQSRQEIAVHPLEVSSYLNKEPGEWLGKILHELEIAIIDERISNEREALLAWVKERLYET
ncbi:tRNA nucleotidyltransferase (CCA-adding enzyme) [Geomicrobium halophilum]|uniref:tRNA nucleotidyltransferase (CCA-adding enzyme) n=1 Tax=Geomicrobium halophilum TaxID=549000 RepID=A0A841PXX4_9BACL|nr:hypothetical protein [Geomicrobium halophilum]MBB6449062.1 tRNA nucleotidyltransferase (CCA-adding enzyme) [Geomicrobium halophilum]